MIKKPGFFRGSFYCIILFLQVSVVFSQGESNIWYFGSQAGLDFNGCEVKVLTNGSLHNQEGCASICDKNGNLLFYTNGMIVWNRNHNTMPDGFDLGGGALTTQTSIIIPVIDNPDKYLLFTANENDTYSYLYGLHYSIIDMNADGGLGDVVEKNILLNNRMGEKMSAVFHENGKDIWLIIREKIRNNFCSYLINTKGDITDTVRTGIGTINTTNADVGCMTVSHDGKYIALALTYMDIVNLFRFNIATGEVSQPTEWKQHRAYGIEFSPDNTMLYVSSREQMPEAGIIQYDIQLLMQNNTQAAATHIENMEGDQMGGALQFAPDGKIYHAIGKLEDERFAFHNYIGVIHNPNQRGKACNYEQNAIYLKDARSCLGLPNFVRNFIDTNQTFNHIDTNIAVYHRVQCLEDTTHFLFPFSDKIDSLQWDFGDPDAGMLNYSDGFQPSHFYSAPILYPVNLSVFRCGEEKKLSTTVTIGDIPDVDLGEDIINCSLSEVILDAGEGFAKYEWSLPKSADRQLRVVASGIYHVKVTNQYNCYDADTIEVAVEPTIIKETFSDITCYGANNGAITVLVEDAAPGLLYSVDNGKTYFQNKGYFIDMKPGNYFIIVEDQSGCYSYGDTITINEPSELVVQHSNRQNVLCFGENNGQITVNATGGTPPLVYQLNDTPEQQNGVFQNLSAGEYKYTVTDANRCEENGTFIITQPERLQTRITFQHTSDCIQTDGRIHTEIFGGTKAYNTEWKNNSEIPVNDLNAIGKGTYYLKVTDANGCMVMDTVDIFCKSDLQMPNVFTPNNDGQNDVFKPLLINGIAIFEITIYNRWGQKMFSWTATNGSWRGTIKNTQKIASDGVYYYKLHAIGYDKKKYNMQGFFHLFRH